MKSISYRAYLVTGLEGALHFLKTKEVPESWKMDMSEILESSSSDEDDEDRGKESEEEEKEAEADQVSLRSIYDRSTQGISCSNEKL